MTELPSEYLSTITPLSCSSTPPRVRNRRELNASLTGATLGDAGGDSEDTLKWIKRAKKRDRELARKRQLELENMDKVFQGDEYTESAYSPFILVPLRFSLPISEDLEGLKVSHDFDELAEGDARILTLKDSRILDNEGNISRRSPFPFSLRHPEDELQNVEMADEERTKKNQELKIKRRDYTGYDDEEFEEGKYGMKRSVLAKYDEVLEGPRETVCPFLRSFWVFCLPECYRVSGWAAPSSPAQSNNPK